MLPLFEHWPSIARQLRAAPTIALFLDFDGTLAQLQPRPEDVWPDGFVRQNLALLARNRRFRVWVISGRRQADVRTRLGVPGIRYLGLHGWEGGLNGSHLSAAAQRSLTSVLDCLNRRLARIPGIWIENKECALTVHHRDATNAGAAQAHSAIQSVIAPVSTELRIQEGACVWEILPREIQDKGAAVRRELDSLPTRALSIYIGDDQVDEPAFNALPHGLTVHVGRNSQSQARYRLAGVPLVRVFLHRLQSEFP